MSKFIAFFKGKKSYIFSGLLVIWAIGGVCFKQLTPDQAITIILGAGGLASVRNAIK